MILFDAGVLIHAFRSDAKNHQRHKEWLEAIINGPAAYGVSPQVLAIVVRVCTHPRIFHNPSSLSDVLEFCRVLLDQPNARMISAGERHWSIFSSMCEAFGTTGNLVQKTWFAALAIESGCEWTTTDPDYARFKEFV